MAFQGDSIYWVEVEKVVPNPFQPRREFDESKLQELSESIRMYGVLQPLTVTRKEVQNEDGTFYSQYELIAGERRLRASRLAGVKQVPVIIREGEQSEQEKLELAIIENLQREDLNAVDRALAFQQLAEQFELSHTQVAQKVGRSREYVANSIRLLQLPQHMKDALQRGELGEGHARTLLMLTDRPEEQDTIFREILLKKMSVREVERIVRKIATDKVRKHHKHDIDQHLIDIEKEFTETLGTRVQIQKTDFGGKLTIDYFSDEDLEGLLERVRRERSEALSAAVAAISTAEATGKAAGLQEEQLTHQNEQQTEQAQVEESEPSLASFVYHQAQNVKSEQPKEYPPTDSELDTSSYEESVTTQSSPEPSEVQVTDVVPSPKNIDVSSTPHAPTHEQSSLRTDSHVSRPDPGLLERLAQHTALSFGTQSNQESYAPTEHAKPVPEQHTERQAEQIGERVDAPAAEQGMSENTIAPEMRTVESTESPSHEQAEDQTNISTAQPVNSDAATVDDSLYSIRNFTI